MVCILPYCSQIKRWTHFSYYRPHRSMGLWDGPVDSSKLMPASMTRSLEFTAIYCSRWLRRPELGPEVGGGWPGERPRLLCGGRDAICQHACGSCTGTSHSSRSSSSSCVFMQNYSVGRQQIPRVVSIRYSQPTYSNSMLQFYAGKLHSRLVSCKECGKHDADIWKKLASIEPDSSSWNIINRINTEWKETFFAQILFIFVCLILLRVAATVATVEERAAGRNLGGNEIRLIQHSTDIFWKD